MQGLCEYRFALGRPGQGVHSVRAFGVALFDVVGTVLLAILSWWLVGGPFWVHLLAWFALGFFLHWLFCVPTSVMEWLKA